MTVHRDVILDLLPLYQSGEASAETRALVEAHLTADAQLARLVAAGPPDAVLRAEPAAASETQRRAALERTRQLIARRQTFLAGAIALSLMPFSFAFGDGHVTFMMLRQNIGIPLGLLGGALACWVAYFRLRRRLRAAGV